MTGSCSRTEIEEPAYEFAPADWYLALAKQLPQDGQMAENPYQNWHDVNDMLPKQEILAFIPGTKHGTREVFEEKVILQGCRDSGAIDEILAINGGDEDAAEAACMEIREDNRAIDIDGDYTETLNRLENDPTGIGVFGLSFYENNMSRLKVAPMGGVEPSTETISSGDYPVSRPLFFYVKKAHLNVIPGLKEYAQFFVMNEVAGPNGPLASYGLVPDPALEETQQQIEAETVMDMPS